MSLKQWAAYVAGSNGRSIWAHDCVKTSNGQWLAIFKADSYDSGSAETL